MKRTRSEFWIFIYSAIKNNHPEWSYKKIRSCTNFAYRKARIR